MVKQTSHKHPGKNRVNNPHTFSHTHSYFQEIINFCDFWRHCPYSGSKVPLFLWSRTEEHAEWQPITSCTLEMFDQSHPLDLNWPNEWMWNLERRSKVCATLRVLICIKRRRLGQLSAKIILGRGVHARSLCLFLSFYIFLTSIARMSKFILLTNWDSFLGQTREADEMFKKNSERQNKWMSRNWFANYPKTGIDRLKQFRILRNILKSQLLRSRPRRCAHSDCVGLW